MECCPKHAKYGREETWNVPTANGGVGKCRWRLDPFLFAIIGTFDGLEGPTQIGTFCVTW